MGFRQDLNITFDFSGFFLLAPRAGYITMGDYNAEFGATFDRQWLAAQRDIIGRARGEIPWFGLLKLTLQPTGTCCNGWGDQGGSVDNGAPKNSWDSLLVSLVVLFAFPFILEDAVRRWTMPSMSRSEISSVRRCWASCGPPLFRVRSRYVE